MWETGDIIVIQSQTWIGRLIRWITQSWASHVAVFVGDGLLFEARPSRAGYVSIMRYATLSYFWRVYRLKTTQEKKDQFVKCLVRKEGRKYDFLQIIYLFILSLLGLRRLVSIKTSHNRSICSEVIFEALNEAGIEWKDWKQSNLVPGDFEKWHLLERIY
jgi:uncharacterized protein YycO